MSEQTDGARKSRRAVPLILVLIATILLFVSGFAIWAKRQLLETDTWVDTSTELLQDAAIQRALADFLVTALYDNVDVEAELAAELPQQVKPLAGPVSGGLRQLADRVALEALDSSRVQDLWENANRTAHEAFLRVIDDEATAVSTTDGAVTLELGAILDQLIDQLGLPAAVADKVPADAANLEILRADQLEAAQTAVDILRTLAWAIFALAIVLYALAIYLAGERRRQTLRAVGIAFVLAGGLLLVAHRVAGSAIVESLSDLASSDEAVGNAWTIGTSQLTEIANAAILYGVFIVIAAWIAGPTSWATAIRDAIAPWYRQARFAYGALGAILILLFWWNPTEGTHRLLPSLVLIALLAIGTEVLRRQIAREFPDRVTGASAAGIAQTIAARMRESREQRAPAHAAPHAPDRVDELERLAKLHDSGALSDEEFAAEKQRVLSNAG
jgi:Short C-terminal domain